MKQNPFGLAAPQLKMRRSNETPLQHRQRFHCSNVVRFDISALFLLLFMLAFQAEAKSLHVSPLGRSTGDGNEEHPIDLATALSGKRGRPGDTFWLREGIYRGHFHSALQGQPEAPITVRQFPGERATIEGTIAQSDGGYVTYWGFELKGAESNHDSRQAGSAPSDLPIRMGLNLRAPGLRLINLIIHDQFSNGIGLWSEAPDAEVYGCLIYHNGWDGPDRGHAHGIYAQNRTGFKRLRDNISFQNYSDGIQVYGTGSAFLNGFELEGNILFNNGIISRSRGGCNLQLGGGVAAQGILIRSNYTYAISGYQCQVNIGSEVLNQDLRFEGNVIAGGIRLMNWRQLVFRKNTVAADNTLLELMQKKAPLAEKGFSWDQNRYASQEQQWRPFSYVTPSGSQGLPWAGWRQATGLDSSSTYVKGRPDGLQVVVRPNIYEPGRGHVVVYNWDRKTEVAVDVKPVLPLGTRFEIRAAQAFYGAPVLSGTYTGQSLRLPMSGWSAIRPHGRSAAPPLTGPEFNVFVLLPATESFTLNRTTPRRDRGSADDYVAASRQSATFISACQTSSEETPLQPCPNEVCSDSDWDKWRLSDENLNRSNQHWGRGGDVSSPRGSSPTAPCGDETSPPLSSLWFGCPNVPCSDLAVGTPFPQSATGQPPGRSGQKRVPTSPGGGAPES